MSSGRKDFVSGFREGFRESGRLMARHRWLPAAAVMLGGAIAIYALVRFPGA